MAHPLLTGVSSKAWPLVREKSGAHVLGFCCCSSVENYPVSPRDCSLDLFILLLSFYNVKMLCNKE